MLIRFSRFSVLSLLSCIPSLKPILRSAEQEVGKPKSWDHGLFAPMSTLKGSHIRAACRPPSRFIRFNARVTCCGPYAKASHYHVGRINVPFAGLVSVVGATAKEAVAPTHQFTIVRRTTRTTACAGRRTASPTSHSPAVSPWTAREPCPLADPTGRRACNWTKRVYLTHG